MSFLYVNAGFRMLERLDDAPQDKSMARKDPSVLSYKAQPGHAFPKGFLVL